jgi:hypothetical protein
MQRIRMIRLAREDLAIGRLGLSELAGLVVFQSLFERCHDLLTCGDF